VACQAGWLMHDDGGLVAALVSGKQVVLHDVPERLRVPVDSRDLRVAGGALQSCDERLGGFHGCGDLDLGLLLSFATLS
jgi:hypothetical protein